jgi:hypothetical protein
MISSTFIDSRKYKITFTHISGVYQSLKQNGDHCLVFKEKRDMFALSFGMTVISVLLKKLRGFSPLANYTDRAIAAGQRS